MASIHPPAQIPHLQVLGSPPDPSYDAFIVTLRKAAEAAKRAGPARSINVVVTLATSQLVMSLNSDLWCNAIGLTEKNLLPFPKNTETYPSGDFRITAKEWVASFATASAWATNKGKKTDLKNAFYILIFFVSEAARLDPVRLQAKVLQGSVEAFIDWHVVLPLLQNWRAISGNPPTMAAPAALCLKYATNNKFPEATVKWLTAMAAAAAAGG